MAYKFTDLYDQHDDFFNSQASAISDLGQVVGYAEVENHWGDTYYHAFLWDSGNIIDLHDNWPANTTYAFAVNQVLQVVGGTWRIAYEIPPWFPSQDAFYCEIPVGIPVLTDLSKNVNGIGRGINLAGAIVGQLQFPKKSWIPVFWPSHLSDPVQLTSLVFVKPTRKSRPTGLGGKAAAINNAGIIVGRADTDLVGNFVGCLWKKHDAPPQRLNPPSGYSQSYAWAINDNEYPQVVGVCGPAATIQGKNPVETGTQYACTWSEVFHLKPQPPDWVAPATPIFPTPTKSFAWDINDQGEIVGSFDSNNGPRAFYTSPSTPALDLNDLVGNNPASSGWVLKAARGINNKGQIVGNVLYTSGVRAGVTHAFLLNPA